MNKYDKRIARIMAKFDALKDREPDCPCGEWPPVWEPPLREKRAAAFEKQYGIQLPEDYRHFLTAVAASGSQPFYGLEPLRKHNGDPGRPFPYTKDHFPYFLYMTREEIDAAYSENDSLEDGLLLLCTEGCGMNSVLVVNSADPETYGTVWYSDLANDCGIIPMRDRKTGRLFHFLDWLEYFADRTAALSDSGFFSYSETAWVPDPPDNPEIMGRKMGWIS